MRKVITKEEARELISKMPTIEPLEETNEKALEDSYKKCIRSFECTEWIRLIKRIYYRKQIRLADGKKTTATDNKYMHLAEEALYQELGIALNIPKEQVLEYVFKEIEKNSEKP